MRLCGAINIVLRCLIKQLFRFSLVLRNALTVYVQQCQLILRIRPRLVRCLAKPLRCLRKILHTRLVTCVQDSDHGFKESPFAAALLYHPSALP